MNGIPFVLIDALEILKFAAIDMDLFFFFFANQRGEKKKFAIKTKNGKNELKNYEVKSEMVNGAETMENNNPVWTVGIGTQQ